MIYCTFITQAYAPYVFDIHFHPHLKLAPVHFHKFLMRAQECLKPFKGIRFEQIFETFERNGYCMHPEGLLLSGITCGEKTIALRALEIHEKALRYHENREKTRRFVKPNASQYNLTAEHWFDALDWLNLSDDYITPSPLIKGLYPYVDELRN